MGPGQVMRGERRAVGADGRRQGEPDAQWSTIRGRVPRHHQIGLHHLIGRHPVRNAVPRSPRGHADVMAPCSQVLRDAAADVADPAQENHAHG